MTGVVDDDLMDMSAFEYQHEEEIKAAWRPKLRTIRWRDLDAAGPESEWLVYQVFTAAAVSLIVGPSQHGKSFFAVEYGMCVARGSDFFGHASLQGGVLYIAAESGGGIKKRLRAYRSWNADEVPKSMDLPFGFLPGKFNLFAGDDDTNALIDDGKHWNDLFEAEFGVPLRLIIVDTFSAATPGADENSARDITPVLARATRISEELGCAVTIVHHANQGGTKPRGHTSIFANVENVVSVELSEKRVDEDGRAIRYAKVTKQKDSEAGASWPFVLRAVEVGTDRLGKPVTSCVCVPPAQDIDVSGPADGGFNASERDRQFLQCVLDAVKNDGQTPPTDLPCPGRITQAVTVNTVKKLFWSRYSAGEEGTEEVKKDALRQRWKRAHDRMVQYGIVGSHEAPGSTVAWMWITGKPVKGMSMGGERKKAREIADEKPSALGRDEEDDFLSGFGE
ncbi:AAA family ATPase [Ancylobacter amanitiformis]|uniref:AAA family ATPase n=1 Tax=Ancylobacter amanitiformis TaxID=217069 RepID=A0ABU0LQC9_9HYPH|nr:AAA family ATPase [Ancylobacter amanitiformis]MDQ0510920.1 hypothetical protein [Ancylobacter amanitiformis]